MTFLFFLKAARTGKFVFSVIGGLSLGYLSLSWGGYQFVYLILPIIAIILVLSKKYNENLLISYAGVQGTGLLVFSLYNRFKYSKIFTDLEIGGIFFFSIILVVFHLLYTQKTEKPALYEKFLRVIKWFIIPGIIVFAIIVWIAPEIVPFGFGARFNTILSPLFRGNFALVASVAEQMPSSWSVFYYQTLIPLLLIPLGIFFCFKRLNAADIFLIAFILLMYYFTGSMIRIILLFAPAAALIGSYGLVSVLKIFGSFLGEKRVGISRKRRRQVKGTLGSSEALAAYILVGFLCIAQVVHTTDIAIDQMSWGQMAPQGVLHEWEETLTWMKNNLDGTDVVVSWWDYGYWLTPIANVTTVNDNATKNATRIGLTGMALMQSNEIYSAKAFRRLGADYVLVYFGFLYSGLGGDEGKWTWMLQICNDHYINYKNKGWEEDNWAANAVFDESEYHNASTGRMEDKWFQSQLVKLMFFGEPTDPDEAEHQFQENYAKEINSRRTDDGDFWATHIPTEGKYETISFTPVYFSKYGMVKLYKLDYTALDSRFVIENPEVFDSGYGTLKLKNTGEKQLHIRSIDINGVEYDFVMGNTSNVIEAGEEDVVWVDIKSKGTTFNKDDVVSFNVTAESRGTLGRIHVFRNRTSNFFVKKAIQGELKINKENSKVIQVNSSSADVYLEVENIGNTIVVLDRFYVNNDTLENRFDQNRIEYLSGSAVLEPGEKSMVYLPNASASFIPIGEKYNKIGVVTPNNIYEEILLTSNIENFSLSILSKQRIYSPEASAILNTYFRKHIPIDFTQSHAYSYDNGSTILKIKIKNTGDIPFGLASVYLSDTPVEEADFDTKSDKLILDPNEEDVIIIHATGKNNIINYTTGSLNEQILVSITTSFSEMEIVASDIGYIHTVKYGPDIQALANVEGYKSSYIYANETGKVLIKNTGNEPIDLVDIEVNNSTVNNVAYIYGDSSLDIQECAIVTFDIPNLKINKSDECILRITTNTTAETIITLNAFVDSTYFDIEINDGGTSAVNPGTLTILTNNNGLFNATIDSVYINGTYFSMDDFNELVFEIGSGGSLELTISIADVGIGLGKTINDGDKLEILVRTIEGAEDIHTEVVI
jgi:asparagine N-glycosylation enzyme membrane subunit Stt3